MNAQRLLQHYEQIADASDAVARLCRFILVLAVRGKLVPQDARDEPASELLKRVAKEKLDQADLPRSWRRAKVGSILEFQYGKGLKASERLDEGPVPVFGSNGIVGFTDEPLTTRPSIIVGRKGSAGALNLCDGPSWTTDVAYFVEVPSFFDLRFMSYTLAALDLDKLGKGVKPGLSRSEAYDKVIALPPLAEQHRIVAKVDELMGLCDRLEVARAGRERSRDRLAAASLARLNAPDPETFQADARFALAALPALTTRPDQIKTLRQTILNLAVRGKLVPQDTSDEPASELLKRIAKEKARLVNRGRIRETETKEPNQTQSVYRPLPRSWEHVTVAHLAYLRSGIALAHDEEQPLGELPYLKVADLSLPENERGITTSSRFVGLGRDDDAIEIGSIVFPKRGGAIATNRKRLSMVRVVGDSNLMAMKPYLEETRAFMELWFSSFDLWTLNSGTSVPQINNKDIYPLELPLPPLAEQHRIVAKVDALMALCDRLEASLTAAAATRRRLLDALLAEALAPVDALEMEVAE